MSSGGSKKLLSKGQGWEEAGSEFYQESFPSDSEFDVFQRDAQYVTTILPSKQYRNAAATIKARTKDRNTKWRTPKPRHEDTLQRQPSQSGEVQVSMLPDLSQNLSNEQSVWEEIMLIKAAPIPMCEKRELKRKLLNQPNLRLQGYARFKWKRRKTLRRLQTFTKEVFSKCSLWLSNLNNIENHFGTGILPYFRLLKMLYFINLIFGIINILILALPNYFFMEHDYQDYQNSSSSDIILNIFLSAGFNEGNLFFYGFYVNDTIPFDNGNSFVLYNLPLVYSFAIFLYFLFSAILLFWLAIKIFKQHLIENEGQMYKYCQTVLNCWDFSIQNNAFAQNRHIAIHADIKSILKKEPTKFKEFFVDLTKMKLLLIRIVINCVFIVVLFAFCYSIYYLFKISQNDSFPFVPPNWKYWCQLLPFMYLVLFKKVISFLFSYLVNFEKYSTSVMTTVILFRTITLNIGTLLAFLSSLYYIFIYDDSTKVNINSCWENSVGQHIFTLILFEFLCQLLVIFFIDVPRALLSAYFTSKSYFLRKKCFNPFKEASDIIFIQTLCWIGILFAPLLACAVFLIFFILFIVKKQLCVCVYVPLKYTIDRQSKLKVLYLQLLICFFIFAVSIIYYSVFFLIPSETCGPFSGLALMWSVADNFIVTLPNYFHGAVSFLSTPKLVITLLIILLSIIYYYVAVNSINRQMVTIMKNQLMLEGHDKQFLLERLSKIIKLQQDRQKRIRSTIAPPEQGVNVTN